MNVRAQPTAVLDALALRGFEFLGPSTEGLLVFRGDLATSVGAHRCEVEVDPNFFELPSVRLLQPPPNLPRVTPHLASGVHLCYIARGSVVLDIFDPVGQTLACIKRAEQVLDQVLQGNMVDDLEEEFYAYWNGPFCLVDMQDTRLGRQEAMLVQSGGDGLAIVTDDRERTLRKLKSLQWKVDEGTILTYRVRTRAKPRPHVTNWPPKTIGDILQWQGLLDWRCRKKIEQRLAEAFATHAKGALVLIESPLLTYGFGVFFERPARKARAPLPKKSVLHAQEATPLSVVRIDDRYMAQRNIPGQQTLAGKRIALIGCGTIGGYLAEMLVKAGAGTSGGQLTVVDFETLFPQNLGRHRLGFNSLFRNKAKEIAGELERAAPGVNIRALPVDVKLAQFGLLDLLIDATGEEALGHWLCRRYVASTPMLTAWIEGPGVAVRGLLRTSSVGACYRCLCDANRQGQLLTVKGKLPTVLAGQGCEGLYVPFPASVSVQAASLAASMALAWANGTTTPALQTRVVDANYEPSTADCDPHRTAGCPACPS